MKQILLLVAILLASALLYVGGMILFGITTKFKPAPVEEIDIANPQEKTANKQMLSDSVFSFLLWNVGYGGLGKEVDFFYDGGKMVTSPKEIVLKDNSGIKKILSENKHVDFVMLQEVDRNSKRSWRIDQADEFSKALPDFYYAFAVNYDVKYLPFPFTDPMGKVYGGLQTLSRFSPAQSARIALPGISDFPRKIFYLERCLLMQRYPLVNNKELIVINTHFEAYDEGGKVKKQQREITKRILEKEYAKGNYVILGGDWNIAPPDFNVHKWAYEKINDPLYLMNNDSVYIEGWNYVYDSTTATDRKNETAYTEGKTYKTILDYFYISPNIDVEEIKAIETGFDFSDHQPVRLTIKLKQ